MTTNKLFMMVLLGVTVSAAAAQADEAIGARVGGYGFRQPATGSERSGWNDCRMNGIGLFGQRTFGRAKALFAEAGLDTYFSEAFPLQSENDGGLPMDRLSALASVAAGVRMFPTAAVSPYVQLGAGVELTKIDVPTYHITESFTLPLAFLGIGGDFRVGKHLKLGAVLRVHAMGHFHDITTNADGQMSLSPSPEVAAQGQFYAMYTF